jgi:YesN/AraC family two-component response regulator
VNTNNRKKISILIAEDEKLVRELLERTISNEGYSVQTACDGEEAWQMIQEDSFDIIISDAKMPRMNGFDLLRKTKQFNPMIGFIIMTAFGDIYSVKEAMFHGADEYISKPFESIEVALVVERICWNNKLMQNNLTTAVSEELI